MRPIKTFAAALLLSAVAAQAGARTFAAKPIVTRTAPIATLAPVGAALSAPSLTGALIAPSLTLSEGLVVPTLQLPLSRIEAAAPAPAALSAALSAAPVKTKVNAASPPQRKDEAKKKKAPVLESLRALAEHSKKTGDSSKTAAAFDGIGPLHLAIVGPPGVGKTTQAKRLARDTGVIHLSVGQLLREYASDKPQIQARMNRGKLVSTDLVMRLVKERLARADVKEKGFILDGFPRRPIEEAALQEILKDGMELDAVIRLDAPRTELKRRILARGRADDKPDVFEERMRVYKRETLPVIEKLEKEVPTLTPDRRMKRIDSIYTSLADRLTDWLGRR